jgi:hypothetical protein
MDKQELKKIIKPLIKECIREVLLEEGLKTLTGSQELVKEEKIVQNNNLKQQTTSTQKKQIDYNKIFKKDIIEKNKKLGFDLAGAGFNPFQGTIAADQKEKMKVETVTEQKIHSMIDESSNQWNKILTAMNGKKDR